MNTRSISWLFLGLFYFLTYSNACTHAESNLLWELNLAKVSRFSAKSSSYSLDTSIAILQSRNGNLSLKITWDFSTLTWRVSIVQEAASGSNYMCISRDFSIPSDFHRQIICTLHLRENENLVLKQGDALVWDSHSCGLCVKHLRILHDGVLKNLKGKANHMVLQKPKERNLSLAQQILFPRRALQESNSTLNQTGSSNSTITDNGSSNSSPTYSGSSNSSPTYSGEGSSSSTLDSSNGGHRNKKALAMEIVFPVAAFLLLVLCLALVFTRRRKAKANQINIGSIHKSRRQEDEVLLETLAPGLPPRFTYAEMQQATNGFQKKLGEGGYGAVYEGILPSSNSRIAVKVFLDTASTACRKGFCAEVMSIGEKKHSNLVQLCGFCVEDDHRMLVYELMENGSLNKVLFGAKAEKSKGLLLSWERRKAIAIDTASALAFLHEEGEQKTPVIHCDVKPENILLNENWVAKVSDFGLAKLMWAAKGHHVEEAEEEDDKKGDGESNGKQKPSAFPSIEVSARLSELSGLISSKGGVRGTLGYVAPEWMRVDAGPDTITTASDVYSFGVVLLELIAGRRSMVPGHPFLPGHAFDMLAEGQCLSTLLDPRIRAPHSQGASFETSTSFQIEDVQRSVNVALWCLQEDLTLRPTMMDVLNMLTSKQPVPSPPFCDYFAGSSHFFDEGEYHHHDHIFSDSTSTFHEKGLETSTNTSQETTSWQVSILSGR